MRGVYIGSFPAYDSVYFSKRTSLVRSPVPRPDHPDLRRWLRGRGVTPRIAPRGIESSDRLGRYRWVVERTVCAARRSVASPVEPGGTWREVSGSNGLPDTER